ncbi:MAG: MFS transporter [Chlamydiota bacterium]
MQSANREPTEKCTGSILRWLIWSLSVLFLFYEFILRIFPAVMVSDLMQAFRVSAGQLGLLSAFYFYAYAPMQIPVGLLMDRFGARNLLSFAALTCGIGSFFFGFAFSALLAALGRFLMGIGSAFAFIGMIYVCSHWFPKKWLGLLVGIGNSIGMLGAVGASGPLTFAVDFFGWRLTINLLGIVGSALAVCLFIFIRKDQEHPVKRGEVKRASLSLIANLKVVCKNKRTWLNALIALLFYMTTAAFASLWGIPFLIESYQLSRNLAGFMISMVFVGWILGGPLIGWTSDRVKKRKPLLYLSTLMTLVTLTPVIYLSGLPAWLLFILLFCVGFFSSAQLLNFSLAIEVNPIEAKGTSIALTNCLVAAGSSLMQPLMGWLLDLRWAGIMKNGVPVYGVADYRFAMISFPVTLVFSFLLLLLLKEGKPIKEERAFLP